MAGFGKGTDYFGIPTLITNTGLKFIESSTTPAPVSVEHAQDEDGNIVGQGDYEGGPAAAVECVYHLLSGTLDLDDLYLGFVENGDADLCAVTIDVDTSNGAWPVITVGGFTGVTGGADYPKFELPAIEITAKRQAQGLDFTVDTNCRLTSSSLSASGEFHHALDEDGDVGAMAFTGATIEISGEAVEIEGVVTWTPGETWTETQAPGASNANIAWGTASFAATKYLEKFTEPED
jgi:hypothetical protein